MARTRMTAADRRAQLIDVARDVFAERGYNAATVEDIAERADVSKPVVYEHFGGKEGLYAVIIDREVQDLTARITSALDTTSALAAAHGSALEFLGYIEEEESGFRVLVHDAPAGIVSSGLASVMSAVADRAEQLLMDGFGDKGFGENTAPMYARMLVGAVTLVGEWWLENDREPDRAAVAAHVVNLMWNGLKDLDPDPVVTAAAHHAAS